MIIVLFELGEFPIQSPSMGCFIQKLQFLTRMLLYLMWRYTWIVLCLLEWKTLEICSVGVVDSLHN